jgi:hypothetical protein
MTHYLPVWLTRDWQVLNHPPGTSLPYHVTWAPWVVLAMVPGYPAAVWVWNWTGWFRSGCHPKNKGTHRVRNWLEPDPGSILRLQQLWLQFRIWVLIVLQHDLYVQCADWCPRSSPILRFAIRSIFIESLRNQAEHHTKIAGFSTRLHDNWSDRKSENGKWKRPSQCIFPP